ncbi:hypothetical protein [Deinococcus sp. YIM 77859]|uniref:hypothetical protein n=1 Tax=Deinococcus sp. YIM 77859 TaxID=1540221 RepID=UPI0005520FF2|nr:hypothetical protein [Deinococcus sp. YIM 77859]
MRPAALLLPLLLSLTACGSRDVQPPEAYDVSGTIGGDWGERPRLRLALVGVGFPSAVTNDGNQPQNVVDGAGGWTFGFDLPRSPTVATVAGVYQVVVYNDLDNSGTYNLGEPFARNRQWLIYSLVGGEIPAVEVNGEEITPAMTVSSGWNLYDRRKPLSAANPSPASKVTGYDLSR